jgi:membrane-bound inhibitor of C-type lysozyme
MNIYTTMNYLMATTIVFTISITGLLTTTTTTTTTTINPVQAESGKGADIFKVIMTIFDVDKSKGDVVAVVTVNNGEASKVKMFESKAFPSLSTNLSSPAPSTVNPPTDTGIIEYVVTFPNVTVNSGAEYKACVVTTKDLDLICKTGHNSPASRPEFTDISLAEMATRGTSGNADTVESASGGEEEGED